VPDGLADDVAVLLSGAGVVVLAILPAASELMRRFPLRALMRRLMTPAPESADGNPLFEKRPRPLRAESAALPVFSRSTGTRRLLQTKRKTPG